jgi:predicted NAD/FAD-binding protein
MSLEKKRVAIIGSGCAGLGAAWALQNTDHEVHVFEKSDRLGGHTNTQTFTNGKHSTPVDTGFIVMNSATYRAFPPYHNYSLSPLTLFSKLDKILGSCQS